ncbi:MAG TPA: DUF1294 domain-containing protein [Metalysinibacillus jejuensis]|uniref:DUF1294 domain-containing protein n=1 Tax=Metalysinibacillus jejuensis TaxID=914327 RepID=A0A921NCG6_9BACL|nr:DUF1294 domain-containing protein [Metalysinibacillus jejuensis]HJH11617.1 DUF1294 domain-containing protein [Metalysinibacillus jejuensis]
MHEVVLGYIVVMSLSLVICMGYDKSQAKKHKSRIAEKTLFTLAIFGGAVGGVLGMYLFRHKTRKNKFAFGFPLLAAVQVFLVVQIWP